MKLSYFNFNLPKDLIADRPVNAEYEKLLDQKRDESRLMVLHRDDGKVEHRLFKDMIDYIDTDDVVVVNNTKVFPARLDGEKEKTGAHITVFLLRELNPEMRLWDVVVEPARKIRIGNKLYFGENESLLAEVIDNTTSRGRTVRFLYDGSHEEFISLIRSMGKTPIPDYILKNRDLEKFDENRYQTLYAKVEGSVAAPIAGLHFSPQLLKRLEIKEVKWAELTLHIGLGSSIEVEDLSKHRMSAEEMHLDDANCDLVNNARNDGHKICCVGATTLRALETAVTTPGKICPFDGWTNKFIFPPYNFTIADMAITSLHFPCSPQFIMMSAFAGPELMRDAYQTAIREKYRFGAYGDAMLII
ncbi:MAG: S-adenosylmethionine:tRNA ribosyltransferase-isomerase [bacterium P3]|nr:MAG: S-adenosylmethionine:tRNA ribosyltransferase-isomerase [bacterium P3]KWW42020.1 MAG: S-adenosylmethionine:tRNA ribosyltransferase-isomerase [bacterium F083]